MCEPSLSSTDIEPEGWRSQSAAGSWAQAVGSRVRLAGCRLWRANELKTDSDSG